MEEDVEEEEQSSSPEEIPGSNQSYIHDIEDDNNDKMDEKALKAFSSFDTVEINNGVKSYECLLSQIDPFLISKYFNVPVLSLRLRYDCIVSKPTPDMRKFIPPLIAGKKYQLITEEQANEKITKCRIIIGSESFEMKCAEYNKDLIMGYMETPQDFVLIDGDGIVIEVGSDTDVKLYDGKTYHVIYDKMDIIKPPIKFYPMPIEFIAGTSINRSMSLFPPYLICISRAMHILTFIGEKFDLRTSTPNNLIGHTVANHAAQVLCRLNDASKKIQFVTSNISNNIFISKMPTNSFTAAFNKNGEDKTNGNIGMKLLPSTDIDHIVDSLEKAVNDMENFLQRLKKSRKRFSLISKLMEKLLQSQKMGKFSFNDLAELLNFCIEVLHYTYLHWLFIKKFSHCQHILESSVSEKLSTQFKNCSNIWYSVSQNVSLPTAISPIFNVQNLWKSYHESIIKAQYTVEILFFANNFED
uniref:Uncharacterized protein n=1 Tax=Panagrolaimus davidi TaxID=227884 RepID=A0A914QY17_9BILA